MTPLAPPARIEIAPSEATVLQGQTLPLAVTARDAAGNVIMPTPAGTWQSSNTAIATVDASGLLTGVTPGTVTITFTINGSGQSGTATIRIRGGDAGVIIR